MNFKLIRITASWEVILDTRCIGLFHVGPVLFPDEGMLWQASALFDLFSVFYFKKRLSPTSMLFMAIFEYMLLNTEIYWNIFK